MKNLNNIKSYIKMHLIVVTIVAVLIFACQGCSSPNPDTSVTYEISKVTDNMLAIHSTSYSDDAKDYHDMLVMAFNEISKEYIIKDIAIYNSGYKYIYWVYVVVE